MLFEELLEAFLYSRKNGIRAVGAKCKASDVTLKNYEINLGHFFDFMREKRNKSSWDKLTRMDVRAYVQHVNDHATWSQSTKLTYLRDLRTMMNFIEKDEDTSEMQSWKKELPVIGKNEQRKFIPSPQELKKWRAAFNTNSPLGYRNYTMFCVMMSCGVRVGELVSIRLNWFHKDDRVLYVEGKTGSRLVSIPSDTVKIVEGWLRRRSKLVWGAKSDYLFTGRRGEKLLPNGVAQIFRKMKHQHNLPHLSSHVVRHAFGTYYLRNGGSLERLRLMMGHTTYEMTKNYLHLAQVGSDAAKEELERVNPLKMLNGR